MQLVMLARHWHILRSFYELPGFLPVPSRQEIPPWLATRSIKTADELQKEKDLKEIELRRKRNITVMENRQGDGARIRESKKKTR